MRLYSLTLKGYKQFADASMNLDSKTIAIVGPNEAGKTSLSQRLSALKIMTINSSQPPYPRHA